MMRRRAFVLAVGLAGAVFAGIHAYTFRIIFESVSAAPEETSQRLSFFAGAPALFLTWVLSAALLWTALIALIPAMWRALGGGRPATAVVGLEFVGYLASLFGDGSQFPTLFLSARYASAPEALRSGLEAAAIEVNAAVMLILGASVAIIFVGAVAAALVSALVRPPGGRWYGALFLVFWIANAPLPGALIFGAMNLILFGAFAFATARGLGAGDDRIA